MILSYVKSDLGTNSQIAHNGDLSLLFKDTKYGEQRRYKIPGNEGFEFVLSDASDAVSIYVG